MVDPRGAAPVWESFLLAPGTPPAPGPPPVEQDEPGFEAHSGSFAPGTRVGLNVLQPLWYWDGQMLATPPAGTVFELESALSEFIVLDPISLPDPRGFDFALAGSEGGVHQHVDFRLPDPNSPDGAYGIVMEIAAEDLLSSDPLLLVFNQRLPNDLFDLGVQAILDASGILSTDSLAGDYNDNGRVEQADLDLVLLNWNKPVEALPEDWINERPTSGIVDQAELDGVLLNWNTTTGQIASAVAVPEPGSLMVAVLVLAGVAGRLLIRLHAAWQQ